MLKKSFLLSLLCILPLLPMGHQEKTCTRRLYNINPGLLNGLRFYPEGETALTLATKYSDADAVYNLLHFCSINTEERNVFGQTALHVAAEKELENICKQLLEYKANPWARNKDGLTPYECALSHGHKTICSLLMVAMHKSQESSSKIGILRVISQDKR